MDELFLKEHVHERNAVGKEGSLQAVGLGIGQPHSLRLPAVIQHPGHRIAVMAAGGHEGFMVGEHEQTEVHLLRLQPGHQGLGDQIVQLAERQHFFVQGAVVGGLVRRLDMQAEEVVVGAQAVKGRLKLAGVVGVNLAGGSLHFDLFEAAQHADAVHQRHRADDAAVVPVTLAEVRQRDGGAFGPDPDAVGRELALGAALLIDGSFLRAMAFSLPRTTSGPMTSPR